MSFTLLQSHNVNSQVRIMLATLGRPCGFEMLLYVYILSTNQGQPFITMTCSQLHKKAERIGCMLMEKGRLNTGDHVTLLYPPGDSNFWATFNRLLKRFIN